MERNGSGERARKARKLKRRGVSKKNGMDKKKERIEKIGKEEKGREVKVMKARG